jgi:hypothetical protein
MTMILLPVPLVALPELQMHTTMPSLLTEMGISLTFYPGWPQTTILPMSASRVAGITGTSHNA